MILIDQTLCAGCAVCVTICRAEAIQCPGMAVVDVEICTVCLDCLDFCPTDAIKHWDPEKERDKRATLVLVKEVYANQKS